MVFSVVIMWKGLCPTLFTEGDCIDEGCNFIGFTMRLCFRGSPLCFWFLNPLSAEILVSLWLNS